MSQTEKARYYQALKAGGVQFSKHYREYSTDELKQSYEALRATGQDMPPLAPEQPTESIEPPPVAAERPLPPLPPISAPDPNELAGARLNTKDLEEPIRTDEFGRVWLQEEVKKPAYPKPRGRRVLKYMDPGVVEQTVKNGEYVETFEVAGDPANARPAEVKITLPSFQVGIYRDQRFPFKVITYNGTEGFDLFDVQNFYGGSEMVPPEVKRMYVENVLCYDIRSTVRAIQTEYRQQQLAGNIQ
jgi:hypothetical protein